MNRIIFACLLALPATAAAEAGPPDEMAVTGGHTSLLALLGAVPPDLEPRAEVVVHLHGDHATIRQVVHLDGRDVQLGVYSGRGRAFPGFSGLRPHRIPALWSLSAAPGDGAPKVAAEPAGDDGLLWRWSTSAAGAVPVAWTVPYAGNEWGGVDPFDCECGDPPRTVLKHTVVTVRTGRLGHPALSKGLPLTVINRSGAEVTVFDGRRRVSALAHDHLWSATTSGRVLTFSFLGGWRPGLPFERPVAEDDAIGWPVWPSRLQHHCEVEAYDDDYELHPASRARWPFTCSTRRDGRTRRVRGNTRVPKALRTAWAERGVDPWEMAPVTADLLRAHVAPAAPTTWSSWPALDAGQTFESNGVRWTRVPSEDVQLAVSSTLPHRRGRYAAEHLLDGDPTRVWCEGEKGSTGAQLRLDVGPDRGPLLVAVVPGHPRSDVTFNANAVPTRWRIDGAETGPQAVPDSADLYREGQAIEVLGVVEGGSAVLEVAAVRRGSRFADTCVGELLVFERR